jgi:hypothetical protein
LEVNLAAIPLTCARISGRLIDAESGKPITEGGRVLVEKREDPVRHTVGASGDFVEGRFDLLVPSNLIPDIQVKGDAAGYRAQERLAHFQAGEWLRDVEFVLDPLPRVNVRGRVVTNEGLAIEGAEVRLWYVDGGQPPTSLGSIRTDERGEFSFANALEGKHAISARKNGYEPIEGAEFAVGGDGEALEVVLERAGGVRVRCWTETSAGATPDAVDLLQDGLTALSATGDGVKRMRARGIVRGVAVSIRRGNVDLVKEKPKVDVEGYMTIEGVPPGAYDVRVTKGEEAGEVPVFVQAGETATVTVRVRP